MGVTAQEPLLQWLAQAGLPEATLESKGTLLIVKLPPTQRVRLLGDSGLRERLLTQAKAFGFTRLALELTTAPGTGLHNP